jgi:hypothetical protein
MSIVNARSAGGGLHNSNAAVGEPLFRAAIRDFVEESAAPALTQ